MVEVGGFEPPSFKRFGYPNYNHVRNLVGPRLYVKSLV